jgi:hypothetical protein
MLARQPTGPRSGRPAPRILAPIDDRRILVAHAPLQPPWDAEPRDARRRAPRLGPDQLIASHITRVGRFRKLDPRKARPLPRFTKFLGVVAWGVFLEESFRRARRAERGEDAEDGAAG